jgi:hypothetical protein
VGFCEHCDELSDFLKKLTFFIDRETMNFAGNTLHHKVCGDENVVTGRFMLYSRAVISHVTIRT